MLLNNQWAKEEIKREIKYLETNEKEIQLIKIYGTKQSNSIWKVYTNKCLPQETRKISNSLIYTARN